MSNQAVEENSGVNVVTTPAGTATATIDRAAVEAERERLAGEAEQAELLAGKFKTPEDLVKAYKELEGKLGQKPQQPPAGETEEPEAGEEETTDGDTPEAEGDEENPYGNVVSEAITKAGIDLDAAKAHFTENGSLSDDDMAAFEKAGFPKEIVDAYLKGVNAPREEAKAMAQSHIDAIKGSVGGDDAFGQLQEFIAGSYDEAKKAAYNEAVSSGDFERALGAVNAAKYAYAQEIGNEGELAGGQGADEGGYTSEAAMLDDMKDPRYKKSAAFRDEVAAKISKSSFHVTR